MTYPRVNLKLPVWLVQVVLHPKPVTLQTRLYTFTMFMGLLVYPTCFGFPCRTILCSFIALYLLVLHALAIALVCTLILCKCILISFFVLNKMESALAVPIVDDIYVLLLLNTCSPKLVVVLLLAVWLISSFFRLKPPLRILISTLVTEIIENVDQFLYLGRILHKDDLDDLAVTARLTKARATWGSLFRILSAEGASCKIMARFYLAIIQATLLHGCESWVLTKRQMRRLDHFHLRCARHIARMNIRKQADGTWVTPNSVDVLERCGLSSLSDYIAKRKTTILQHYAYEHSSLYRRCFISVPTSDRHHLVWWDDPECKELGIPPLIHSSENGPSSRKRVRAPSDSEEVRVCPKRTRLFF